MRNSQHRYYSPSMVPVCILTPYIIQSKQHLLSYNNKNNIKIQMFLKCNNILYVRYLTRVQKEHFCSFFNISTILQRVPLRQLRLGKSKPQFAFFGRLAAFSSVFIRNWRYNSRKRFCLFKVKINNARKLVLLQCWEQRRRLASLQLTADYFVR